MSRNKQKAFHLFIFDEDELCFFKGSLIPKTDNFSGKFLGEITERGMSKITESVAKTTTHTAKDTFQGSLKATLGISKGLASKIFMGGAFSLLTELAFAESVGEEDEVRKVQEKNLLNGLPSSEMLANSESISIGRYKNGLQLLVSKINTTSPKGLKDYAVYGIDEKTAIYLPASGEKVLLIREGEAYEIPNLFFEEKRSTGKGGYASFKQLRKDSFSILKNSNGKVFIQYWSSDGKTNIMQSLDLFIDEAKTKRITAPTEAFPFSDIPDDAQYVLGIDGKTIYAVERDEKGNVKSLRVVTDKTELASIDGGGKKIINISRGITFSPDPLNNPITADFNRQPITSRV